MLWWTNLKSQTWLLRVSSHSAKLTESKHLYNLQECKLTVFFCFLVKKETFFLFAWLTPVPPVSLYFLLRSRQQASVLMSRWTWGISLFTPSFLSLPVCLKSTWWYMFMASIPAASEGNRSAWPRCELSNTCRVSPSLTRAGSCSQRWATFETR